MEHLPENWRAFLAGAADFAALDRTLEKLAEERSQGEVFPPEGKVFTAFQLTSPEKVRVVLLGQDPYHDDGQAEGLSFSVPAGMKLPPSLRNIYKEYAEDLGRTAPGTGSLRTWAEGGVLLLNTILSVRAHQAGSHRKKLGWETFTDAVIKRLGEGERPLVFLLWGGFAAEKRPLIDESRHLVVESVHPSPLSAYRGFFGSRPFSQAQTYLNWNFP